MPLWSVWTAGAFLCPHCDTPQARGTPREPREGIYTAHSVNAPRRASQSLTALCPPSPPREGAQPPACPARSAADPHALEAAYLCERLQAPLARLIPREGKYTTPPIIARPAPSVRVLEVIRARRPRRSAASRCPGSAEKGPPRSGSPSFSAQFPADFRKISDPVLKIFSASFKNRIFIFRIRDSR